ncbi:MAG: CoA pyrophosphatase [Candidatus Neomarinimicrobiota bacterium]|jgi:8-oxo-dGTP pyrophosphatase MutT (NUDIX family)|nr:CoA pyrophosphatase [Candidatus Neomarinimicrobiota bacterium]MDX9781088.1 CoA pyrophosphatase [bacterium]
MPRNGDNIIGKSYKYLNAAVLIPLVRIDGEEQLLFERRSADIIQGSEVCFPGGRFDKAKDRSLKATAVRESCEELGISRNKVRVFGKLGTLIAPVGVAVEAYLARLNIRRLKDLNINKAEVEKVFTVPLSWFKKNPPKEHHLLIEIHPFYYNDNREKEQLFPVKDYALPERYEEPWKGRRHPVFVYNTPSGVIWGITAELIREFGLSKFSR